MNSGAGGRKERRREQRATISRPRHDAQIPADAVGGVASSPSGRRRRRRRARSQSHCSFLLLLLTSPLGPQLQRWPRSSPPRSTRPSSSTRATWRARSTPWRGSTRENDGQILNTLDQNFKESINQSPARPLHMTNGLCRVSSLRRC